MKGYGSGPRQWAVKKVLGADGRYWPYLLHNGIPQPLPTLWVKTVCGADAVNTADSYLRDVQVLYELADSLNVIVEERLRSLNGFRDGELRSIASRLGRTALGSQASKSTCSRRSETLKSFLKFAFDFYKQFANLSLIEQAQVDRNSLRQCKIVARQLRIAASAGEGPTRATSLTPEDVALIDRVIHPDSNVNPFRSRGLRFRNYCLLHVMLATGLRRGEAVLLELSDVDLGATPTIRIRRPTSVARRKRRDGASMKTLGRQVPISLALANVLEQYRDIWRLESVTASAPSPAFFLSTRDGRRLSAYTINRIIDEIGRVPEVAALGKRIHPHGMRSTAVNSIRRKIVEMDSSNSLVLTDALAYVGGWSQRSPMVGHYTRAAISERLSSVLREKWGDEADEHGQ